MSELRKLKQGKLSIERYIEKYSSLVQKSHTLDPELVYQWFIAGLSPGERQSVTGWAADRELRGEAVSLQAMMDYLRIKERKNATVTALAEKGEILLGEDSDVQPMDIGAVTTQRASAHKQGGKGLIEGSNAPRRPREQRTCFFCGKIGHLIRDCKRMQKAKELEKRDWEQRRKSFLQDKKKQQGNSQAPTQHAAL